MFCFNRQYFTEKGIKYPKMHTIKDDSGNEIYIMGKYYTLGRYVYSIHNKKKLYEHSKKVRDKILKYSCDNYDPDVKTEQNMYDNNCHDNKYYLKLLLSNNFLNITSLDLIDEFYYIYVDESEVDNNIIELLKRYITYARENKILHKFLKKIYYCLDCNTNSKIFDYIACFMTQDEIEDLMKRKTFGNRIIFEILYKYLSPSRHNQVLDAFKFLCSINPPNTMVDYDDIIMNNLEELCDIPSVVQYVYKNAPMQEQLNNNYLDLSYIEQEYNNYEYMKNYNEKEISTELLLKITNIDVLRHLSNIPFNSDATTNLVQQRLIIHLMLCKL